jgi:predicted metal-binding protein
MRIGIIRCQQTEDLCPGTRCLVSAQTGVEAFQAHGPVEVVGFISCGGCPGKKAVARAKELEEHGAEMIFFGSCMVRGLPWDYPCPHWSRIKASLTIHLAPTTRLCDWTHA